MGEERVQFQPKRCLTDNERQLTVSQKSSCGLKWSSGLSTLSWVLSAVCLMYLPRDITGQVHPNTLRQANSRMFIPGTASVPDSTSEILYTGGLTPTLKFANTNRKGRLSLQITTPNSGTWGFTEITVGEICNASNGKIEFTYRRTEDEEPHLAANEQLYVCWSLRKHRSLWIENRALQVRHLHHACIELEPHLLPGRRQILQFSCLSSYPWSGAYRRPTDPGHCYHHDDVKTGTFNLLGYQLRIHSMHRQHHLYRSRLGKP